MWGEDKLEQRFKALTLRMARAVVDQPDEVQVDAMEGTTTLVVELRVPATEMGRIIGRKGIVANAMRVILRASAAKERQRVSLEISAR